MRLTQELTDVSQDLLRKKKYFGCFPMAVTSLVLLESSCPIFLVREAFGVEGWITLRTFQQRSSISQRSTQAYMTKRGIERNVIVKPWVHLTPLRSERSLMIPVLPKLTIRKDKRLFRMELIRKVTTHIDDCQTYST